eukprot:GHVU01042635.1.p1 GENE.GHVU01042635.1~~GHVU01042635.1.p1  ORF type:complete len:130 (+),score=5.09 GHVU01042635.1:70-459(+)
MRVGRQTGRQAGKRRSARWPLSVSECADPRNSPLVFKLGGPLLPRGLGRRAATYPGSLARSPASQRLGGVNVSVVIGRGGEGELVDASYICTCTWLTGERANEGNDLGGGLRMVVSASLVDQSRASADD